MSIWWIRVIGGGIMRRINAYQFYQLGHSIHALTEIKEGQTIKENIYILYLAAGWINQYLNQQVIPVRMNPAPAWNLLSAIRTSTSDDFPVSPPANMDKQLNSYECYQIQNAVKEFEVTLSYDLPNLDTYCVSQKGIYVIADLIDHADHIFSETIRLSLPDKAKSEICQAGRCLAFECPTASGFHIARAIEATLLEYLSALSPNLVTQLKPAQRSLATYIDLAQTNGADRKVCAALHQFRDLHRNPLMHPEDVLSTDEAQNLLGIAESAMRVMALEKDKLLTQAQTTALVNSAP